MTIRKAFAATSGVCFFGDCWGFSSQVAADPKAVMQRLLDLHEHLGAVVSRQTQSAPGLFMLSDSVFLVSIFANENDANALESNAQTLETMLHVVENLCQSAYSNRLPMKGALGFGSIHAEANALLGTAILDAVKLGENLLLPIPIVGRHTIERMVSAGAIPPEYLRETTVGHGVPRFKNFIDVPTRDGILLGHPILYQTHSIECAIQCFEREIKRNLESETPHPPSARVLRKSIAKLTAWNRLNGDFR